MINNVNILKVHNKASILLIIGITSLRLKYIDYPCDQIPEIILFKNKSNYFHFKMLHDCYEKRKAGNPIIHLFFLKDGYSKFRKDR